MTLLRKFVARSWADKVLLVRAFWLVSGVRLGLWALPFRTVQRLVDHPVALPVVSPGEGALRTEYAYQRRVVGAVEAIGRRLLGDKPCLVQALVAQRLMRQGGYDSALRIGVAKDGRELLAHAWLERGGRVIIGGGTSPVRYKPLDPVASQAA
jgi:hypothetical protein